MDLDVETNILEANDIVAVENRRLFDTAGVLVINLMSSPGSGKTTLLEKMAGTLAGQMRLGVIEGDIATTRDADRLTAVGVPAVQISTGSSCHLSANMISSSLSGLDLDALDVLFVENVGNLVCPAEFDIGEHLKVTLLSVTEGDEKPLKYPAMFHVCNALVINKLDLMPYTNFDLAEATSNALSINPKLEIFPLSCTTGEGLEAWISWVRGRLEDTRKRQQ